MKSIAAFLLLCCATVAGEPRIVGSVDSADDVIHVQQNEPPWISLSLEDVPDESIQTWAGPVGVGKVGFHLDGGVGVATGLPGTYHFRVIVQVPLDGPDTIDVYESTVIIEPVGPQPVPPPPPPPPEDFDVKLTNAVRAVPDAHAALERAANTYTLVADQVKAGLLTEGPQVNQFTDLVVGLIPEYADIKAKIVDPHVVSLALSKAADFEPVWRQIAAAIKAGLTDIPPPDPEPDVDPLPVTSLHVLIIEETSSRNTLPASQLSIFTSAKVREWLDENDANWRMWDKDVDATRDEQVWQDAMQMERGDLPWIIVSNGSKGFSGPLPKTADETIALMERYK